VPSTAVDFLQAGCKQASTTTNRFILNIYILHLRVLLYSGLFLTLLQNSTGSTGWGDISLLGALKFTLSEFSWWEQGLQAACFDSLPATNGREKVGANGEWGQPGLLPSQIAQATTHQRYRPCMGLHLASQAMGRGAQSRAEHACNATRFKGWPQGSFGIALTDCTAPHCSAPLCQPRHGQLLIRRGEIYPPAEPWITKTASLPVAAQQTARTLLI
jgi:hypothetical protein